MFALVKQIYLRDDLLGAVWITPINRTLVTFIYFKLQIRF